MERAIRVVSVQRGFDPRDFALLAFGGAGGMHACEIAETLDIATVIVPRHAGVLSALGMLLADVIKDYAPDDPAARRRASTPASSTALFAPLVGQAAADLRREGFAAGADAHRAPARRALRRPVVRDHRAAVAGLPRRVRSPPRAGPTATRTRAGRSKWSRCASSRPAAPTSRRCRAPGRAARRRPRRIACARRRFGGALVPTGYLPLGRPDARARRPTVRRSSPAGKRRPSSRRASGSGSTRSATWSRRRSAAR